MEDNAVRRLVEMLSAFFTEGRAVEEDLANSLTNEFLRNIQDVLLTKQIASFSRYLKYFKENWAKMLSGAEDYLYYVFNACMHNILANTNIFERFIGAFAIIIRITIETRLRTRADFCKLVPDIFMVLYEEEMKNTLDRRGGFYRFVQYINNPNYIQSKCVMRNITSTYDPNVSIHEIPADLRQKARKMNGEEKNFPKTLKFEIRELSLQSLLRAKKVLENSKPEFVPTLSKDPLNHLDSNQQSMSQPDGNKRTLEKHAEGKSNLTSKHCPNLNFPSETNVDSLGLMAGSARYENIIEAVIRHNHSKSSGHLKPECKIQTEAEETLEHLQKTTKSLIDVLDEYDK